MYRTRIFFDKIFVITGRFAHLKSSEKRSFVYYGKHLEFGPGYRNSKLIFISYYTSLKEWVCSSTCFVNLMCYRRYVLKNSCYCLESKEKKCFTTVGKDTRNFLVIMPSLVSTVLSQLFFDYLLYNNDVRNLAPNKN